MVGTDFSGTFPKNTREVTPGSSVATAVEVAPAGAVIFGITIQNRHSAGAITVSGVPNGVGGSTSDDFRFGAIVAASGIYSQMSPLGLGVTASGIKVYSTSAGGTSSLVTVSSDI